MCVNNEDSSPVAIHGGEANPKHNLAIYSNVAVATQWVNHQDLWCRPTQARAPNLKKSSQEKN